MKSSTWRVVNLLGNTLLSPPRTIFGTYRNRAAGTPLKVALTFDDGPARPSTEALLDVLAKHDAPATFFCVGELVDAHPDIVRRIVDEGHVVANHSMTHGRGVSIHPTDTSAIDDGSAALERVLGAKPALYRPPWGWLAPWAALRTRRRGLTCVGWDVYPDDWKLPEPDPQLIIDQVLAEISPGSIVLLHDGRAVEPDCDKTVTAEAVDRLIPAIRSLGWELVTVPELLEVEAYHGDIGARIA